MHRGLILLAGLAATALAQETPRTPELVKGTGIRVVRPEGFKVATRFAGFMNDLRMASIVVTPMPGKPDLAGFTNEKIAARGMRVLKRSSGEHGLLLHLAQTSHGLDFRKWMRVIPDGDRMVLVVATYRLQDKDLLEQTLRSAVLSARKAAVAVDPARALPFVLGPSARFRHRRIVGTVVVLGTRDFFAGKPRRPEEPVFVVAPGQSGPVAAAARRSVFVARLKKTEHVRDVTPGKVRPIEIDGLPGLECTATALHHAEGSRIVVYQAMLFGRGGYYVLQGQTVPKAQDRDVAEFKQLTRTFRRKRK